MAETKTLQSELKTAFERIWRRETFESPLAIDLKRHFDKAILSAAIAKCVELNLLINGSEVAEENAFLFISNLRGIAEDLIVLQFVAKMTRTKRCRLLTLIQRRNLHDALLTQVEFFAANNPFQPVAGGRADDLKALRQTDRDELRAFWAREGEPRRDGPTVRDMADRTGLTHTYNYIYFLSSNFVHFNPHTLIRTGWGPEVGPFRFSLHNFAAYYADLASFYGAVLFVGFYYRLGRGFFSDESEQDVVSIPQVIDDVPRWPEIVTFEEMNRQPPMLPFMAYAMRKAMEGTEDELPFGAILREVRGL